MSTRQQAAPLLAREFARIGSQYLNADMVRPGLFVLVDPPNDGVLVPPRDDRVEQSVADRGQIVLSEAAAKQIVGVVRQCQIGTQPVGSDGACLIVVIGQEHRLLGKQ